MLLGISSSEVEDFSRREPGYCWWFDPADGEDGTLLTTNCRTAPSPTSQFLMEWNAAWFDQWDEDWVAAAEYLSGVLISTPDA